MGNTLTNTLLTKKQTNSCQDPPTTVFSESAHVVVMMFFFCLCNVLVAHLAETKSNDNAIRAETEKAQKLSPGDVKIAKTNLIRPTVKIENIY